MPSSVDIRIVGDEDHPERGYEVHVALPGFPSTRVGKRVFFPSSDALFAVDSGVEEARGPGAKPKARRFQGVSHSAGGKYCVADLNQLQALGEELFDKLFDDQARSRFEGIAVSARTAKTRLRLRIDLTQAEALTNVPWETLYHGRDFDDHLGQSARVTVQRRLSPPTIPDADIPISPPVKFLIVSADPSGQLDIEKEIRRIRKVVAGINLGHEPELIELQPILRRASPDVLLSRLRLDKPHILHFIGHGGPDGIEMHTEGAPERGATVAPDTFRQIVQIAVPRLVVLNSCDGAVLPSADIFGGVAQKLVREGVPFVVAMQFTISDSAATAFSKHFYEGLFNDEPVDLAISNARKAIRIGTEADSQNEFITPVLYSYCDEDQLIAKPPARPPAAMIVPPSAELELGEGMYRLDRSSEADAAEETLYEILRSPRRAHARGRVAVLASLLAVIAVSSTAAYLFWPVWPPEPRFADEKLDTSLVKPPQQKASDPTAADPRYPPAVRPARARSSGRSIRVQPRIVEPPPIHLPPAPGRTPAGTPDEPELDDPLTAAQQEWVRSTVEDARLSGAYLGFSDARAFNFARQLNGSAPPRERMITGLDAPVEVLPGRAGIEVVNASFGVPETPDQPVVFPAGSAEATAEAKAAMALLGWDLHRPAYSALHVRLVGRQAAGPASDPDLGVLRAETLAGLLVRSGVARERIVTASAGSSWTAKRAADAVEVELFLPGAEQIFFGFDDSAVPPDGRETAARAAAWLAEHPQAGLVVRGHADKSGPAAYNQRLSEQRAKAAADALIESGIPAARLHVEALGETQPSFFDPDDPAASRRAELFIRDWTRIPGAQPPPGIAPLPPGNR